MKRRKKKSVETLDDLIELNNSRGMAGELYSNTDDFKKIIEFSVAGEFQKSAKPVFAVSVTDIQMPDNDPPDIICKVNGQVNTVEITELMNSEFHHKFASSRKLGEDYSAHRGTGAKDSQWTKQIFFERLGKLIKAKDDKYLKRGLSFNILLVCSGEYWLLPEDVTKWLEDLRFDQPESFNSVILLLGYHPNWSNRYHPIFHVVGERLV